MVLKQVLDMEHMELLEALVELVAMQLVMMEEQLIMKEHQTLEEVEE